jgi:hypothetical protein
LIPQSKHLSLQAADCQDDRVLPLRYEFIGCEEFALRLNVRTSWVREHVRSRVSDPIPHYKMGKYVNFNWGSPELEEWIQRRMIGPNNKVGRPSRKETIQ